MYGPVRTVVWEGSGREACPYPDLADCSPGGGDKLVLMPVPVGAAIAIITVVVMIVVMVVLIFVHLP